MLEWFEKNAPIRTKFDTLRYLFLTWYALSLGATLWAGTSASLLYPGLLSGLALVAALITISAAKHRICDPYVNTVVRMEALAAGDLDSPIRYAHHTDCVGRMVAAMDVFRLNAQKASSLEDLDQILLAMERGLLRLAEGDLDGPLTEHLPAQAEILRQYFNNAIGQLAQTLGSVSFSSQSISSAAGEIRAASGDLATRTEQQASSIQEANAAMKEVTTLVDRNTASVIEVNQSIADAHREATQGGRIVDDAVTAMNKIQSSSQEISQIINVIDGIAFQTNLLALNAGVEAARAGDSGRGFAVVANEVRALAQRSAEAAREIKNLINTSSEHVCQGVDLVSATGKALSQIVTRVGEVSSLVQNIAQSAKIQVEKLTAVSNTVNKMDTMTQQNAAMVEQSNAAAQTLADEAAQMASNVGQFRLAEGRGLSKTGFAAAPGPAYGHRPGVVAPASCGNLAIKARPDADWDAF